MSGMPDQGEGAIGLPRLRRALHPLGVAPAGAGWNHGELADLLPAESIAAQAAVLVPLLPRDGGLQVLLTRRTEALRHHPGQVSFPGGRVEAADADPVAAALREAHEEVGLAPALAEPLGYLDPLATVTGFRVLPVVARIDPAFVAMPDPSEVAEAFEVPLDWLMAPGNLQRVALAYRGRDREVFEFLRHPAAPAQRIWGATASILFNLRQRLEQFP